MWKGLVGLVAGFLVISRGWRRRNVLVSSFFSSSWTKPLISRVVPREIQIREMESPRTMENWSMTMIAVVATTERENSSVQILRRSILATRSNLFESSIFDRAYKTVNAWYKWKRCRTVEIFLWFLLLSNWHFFTSPINVKYFNTRSKWKKNLFIAQMIYLSTNISILHFVRSNKDIADTIFSSPLR